MPISFTNVSARYSDPSHPYAPPTPPRAGRDGKDTKVALSDSQASASLGYSPASSRSGAGGGYGGASMTTAISALTTSPASTYQRSKNNPRKSTRTVSMPAPLPERTSSTARNGTTTRLRQARVEATTAPSRHAVV